ncbi:MAG: MMPL family transporter [Deltaproteobacteria bacterium]|jgi:uncharacterized protein|nr:MMPL family transporter [Deltaproteobacteria bacterium]
MRTRVFNKISQITARHPWKIIAIAMIITVVASVYAALTVKLNANLDDLVSKDLEYNKRYLEFLEEFGDEEYLYVVVDAGEDMPRGKKFVRELAAKLEGVEGLKQILWRIDNPVLEKNFLLYMSPEQLNSLGGMLTEGPFNISNISRWNSFSPLIGALADRVAQPVSTEDEGELTQGFTFIDGLLDDMAASLLGNGAYESRLQLLFFGDGETFDPDGYYRNGDLLFLMIMPEKDFTTMEVIKKPLADIRQAIDDTKKDFEGLEAGLTGRPVLAADEIMTSNDDMTRATILAILFVGLLFLMFFRSFSRPALAIISLLMGIAWTYGFVAILYGTLNILSIVFTLILIGASIEYAIHIVARYQEELAETGDIELSMSRALSTSGRANLTSALTTAAAFLTITWTDFTALAQLGIIAASGILLCLTSMLIALPAMIIVRDRYRAPMDLKKVKPFTLPGIKVIYKRPWILAAVSIVISIIVIPHIMDLNFDNNLLNLQAKGLDSVKYEHLIIDKSTETTWFARSIADNIDESNEKAAAFAKLPTVRRVDGVERVLPNGQDEKIKIVNGLAPAFANIKYSQASGSVDRESLKSKLKQLENNLGRLEADAFSGGRVDAVEELGRFGEKVRRVVDLIDSADDVKLKGLGSLQKSFIEDMHKHIDILSSGMKPDHIYLKDLPKDLAARFVSPKGRYALFIYPKDNIWDPLALQSFIDDLRSVDPNAFGTPIGVHESGKLMRDTFERSAVLAFIVICILVLIDFRSWKSAMLAVMPLSVGLIWLIGFMGLFDIPFNMANFFAIPILIGIGVDFGVHLVHRLRSEKSFDAIASSTGRGVILTAATNAVGFGAMTMAAHRGIASLGMIMAIGAICCLLAALIAMPPMARILDWGRRRV